MRLAGDPWKHLRLVSSAAPNTSEWAYAFMRIIVDIPALLFRRLKSRAAKDGRFVNELILQSVESDLEPRHKRLSRRISLPLICSKQPGPCGWTVPKYLRQFLFGKLVCACLLRRASNGLGSRVAPQSVATLLREQPLMFGVENG